MSDLLRPLRRKVQISPQALPGLWAWFDPADTTTVIESAGKVSQLNDKSSNQFNIIQAVEFERPSIDLEILAGKRVLSFSPGAIFSGSEWLENQSISGILNGADQSFTVFSLMKDLQSANATFIYSLSDKSELTSKNFFIANETVANKYDTISFDNSGVNSVSGVAIGTTGGFDIQTIRVDYGNSLTHKRINGQLLSNTAQSSLTFANVDTLTIGAGDRLGSVETPFIGHIAEIIIYNKALNDQEIIAIEQFLSNKWGIPLI